MMKVRPLIGLADFVGRDAAYGTRHPGDIGQNELDEVSVEGGRTEIPRPDPTDDNRECLLQDKRSRRH